MSTAHFNPDGTRNRDYRPYIEHEESVHRSVTLYDPNGRQNFGLYDCSNHACRTTRNHVLTQHPPVAPAGVTLPLGLPLGRKGQGCNDRRIAQGHCTHRDDTHINVQYPRYYY